MRVVAVLTLLAGSLVLAGCASSLAQADKSGASIRILNIPDLGDGIFHCDGPGAASQNHGYPKCNEIPVVVLETGTGCASLLPYNLLQVHVGRGKPSTDITWVLVAADGYKFDKTNGIAVPAPGSTYDGPGLVSGSQDRKFRWTVKAGAAPLEAKHEAKVLSPLGAPCTPIDPRVVNTDQ